jgi:hypothetical protein
LIELRKEFSGALFFWLHGSQPASGQKGFQVVIFRQNEQNVSELFSFGSFGSFCLVSPTVFTFESLKSA